MKTKYSCYAHLKDYSAATCDEKTFWSVEEALNYAKNLGFLLYQEEHPDCFFETYIHMSAEYPDLNFSPEEVSIEFFDRIHKEIEYYVVGH